MTRWHLIAAAVLAAGCEQWKAPKRIHELEGRVDELAKELEELKGAEAKPKDKPKAKAKPKEHEDEDHAAAGETHAKAAETEHAPEREAPAKKDRDEDEDKHGKDKAKDDEHSDDPMERIKQVVAKNTGNGAKVTGIHDAPHWSYQGKTGPAAWGELDPTWKACGEGQAQSPIDIEPRAGSASPIAFSYKPTAATVIDNGHTLQVNLAPGSTIEIDERTYALVQFHFHTPSEHTLAGEHYPLEIHLVHKNNSGKLAVIGVLYDAGVESKALGDVWARWPRKTGVEDKLRKPFDPTALLPDTRTVFRYAGSLTTPPCTEGVVWNVMRRTLSDSKPHLAVVAQHYALNAREPQPLNDRKVE